MGDHDLGVAGADGRGRPAGVPGGGRGGLRALGAPLHADRRSHRYRRAARLPRRRDARRDPGPPADRRGAPVSRRAAAAHPPPHPTLRPLCPGCSPRRTSAAAPGSTSATTTWSARGRCAARAWMPRCCGSGPRCGGSRSRWTAPRRTPPVRAAGGRAGCPGGGAQRRVRRREAPGLTDCLNFGNPEKPEVAWELVEAIEGIALAAEALGVPVVSGNVSLYNETDGRAIPPTPVVGCVGLVPDVRVVPSRWRKGDVVLVAGSPTAAARPRRGGGLVEFLWRAAPLSHSPRRLRRRPPRRARRGCALERGRRRRRAA